MLGFKRAVPSEAVWRPARLWVIGGGKKGGVHAVALLNGDFDNPDLAMTGGVWTSTQAGIAASEGFEVTEHRGKVIARLPDGTVKSLVRPNPRMQHIADERFDVVRKTGFGPNDST